MERIERTNWQEARKDVQKLDKKLAAIIDKIDPSNEYSLYKATYQFGDEVLKNAELYLPSDHGLLPAKSDKIAKKIRDELDYNFGSNPVGLLLKGSSELFINLGNRVIPYAIVPPGKIFGTWRILDTGISHCPPTFLWGMTAGARSIFLLPKISETASHNQLSKKFQLRLEKPSNLNDHWKIFKELANHPSSGEPWKVEFLFFSKKWFEKLHTDPAWSEFKLLLHDRAWQSSSYWRNEYIWNLVFSMIQTNKHLKPPAYISDIVKHILAIAVGALPGFRPALDDSLGPMEKIQSIYVDHYNLKPHLPIIMQPDFLTAEKQMPIYYSLQHPTAVEFSPKSSTRNSTLTDLFLASSLLKKYLEEIESGKLNINGTPLKELPTNTKFEYFHNNVEQYHDLKESATIPEGDKSFIAAYKYVEDRTFPKNSSFFNGCIRISKNGSLLS